MTTGADISAFHPDTQRVPWGARPSTCLLCLQRLGESLSQRAKLRKLKLRQLWVASSEVSDRCFKPLRLVLQLGADNAAPHDVLKELVPRLVQRRLLCRWRRVRLISR